MSDKHMALSVHPLLTWGRMLGLPCLCLCFGSFLHACLYGLHDLNFFLKLYRVQRCSVQLLTGSLFGCLSLHQLLLKSLQE